jgi:hypothetical protein
MEKRVSREVSKQDIVGEAEQNLHWRSRGEGKRM